MIRVALRQLRTEMIIAFGGLAALAMVLVATGPHLAQVNDAFQNACRTAGDCTRTPNPVFGVDMQLQLLLPLVVTFVPALIGLFVGAPLVARELETGTYRLAWTQSVTVTRWLTVKLGLAGLASMVVAGLITWMIDLWSGPLDAALQERFDPVRFGWHGVAPIGYTAFAFALGTLAGVVLRRTVPAMGVTLAAVVTARITIQNWVRPNLAPPLHETLSVMKTGFGTMGVSASAGTFSLYPPSVNMPQDWLLSTAVVNSTGQTLTSQEFVRACPAFHRFPTQFQGAPLPPAVVESAHAACIHRLVVAGYHTVVTYQPSSRFWPFQWAEMGIFLVAALTLCGLTYWWMSRRFG